jgi:3-oxoacyl-[acyl-carrier protein] reductase
MVPVAESVSVPVPVFPDLAGKVAVVTGGSKGIGAATCRMLAVNGVKVAVNGRDRPGIESAVAQLCESGATASAAPADCTRFSEIETMRSRVEADLGPTDILVAFAGGFGAFTAVHETSEEEWRAVIDSNLTATFLTIKSFLPGMIERRRGVIVTMASNAGRLLDMKLTASYAAAKAGIAMLTRHVALEVGRHGIRVNCVAPATVRSERVDKLLSQERQAEVAAMSPLGRMGVPEDVAAAALFLASESAGWLTGVTVDVAGGRIML